MDSRKSLLHAASVFFRESEVSDSDFHAELLLLRCLDLTRVELVSDSEAEVTAADAARFRDWTARFAKGEPLAYLEGIVGFRNLELRVDARVLVPRPDSEVVVEAALAELHGMNAPQLVDVGTGSGCLLLALLDELPSATGIGIDFSSEALEVARANAEITGLAARAGFLHSSWLSAIPDASVDLVISNPPYIQPGEELGPGVAEYEPHLALFTPEEDPLYAYRAILEQARKALRPQRSVVFEVGAGRAAEVAALGVELGYIHAQTQSDLGGIERAVVLRRPTTPNG